MCIVRVALQQPPLLHLETIISFCPQKHPTKFLVASASHLQGCLHHSLLRRKLVLPLLLLLASLLGVGVGVIKEDVVGTRRHHALLVGAALELLGIKQISSALLSPKLVAGTNTRRCCKRKYQHPRYNTACCSPSSLGGNSGSRGRRRRQGPQGR